MNKNQKINKPIQKGVAKVPVVMQMEAVECGAACLTMILEYYGKWIPLEKVRFDCGVSRDGSNAKNILMAARNYGLKASGFKMEPEHLVEMGTFPCIIHWNFDHFVVINGIKNNKVYINDPARGNYIATMKEFDESFTGICLTFEPTDSFEPSGSKRSVMDFAAKRLQGSTSALVFMALSCSITAILGLISVAFSRVFLDRIITGANPEWIKPFFILFLVIVILQLIAGYIEAIYAIKIYGKMAVVSNSEYMWKVLHLPMQFFSQRLSGDIKMRQESNESVAATFIDTFAPLMVNSAMLIFYLYVMFRYSIMLTVVGLFSIVINLFMANLISKKRINITRVLMRDEAKKYGTMVSGIEMIETIKASGAENGFFEKWSGYQASVNSQSARFMKLNSYLGLVPGLVNTLTGDLILILGVYQCIAGRFTVGMIMAFQGFYTAFKEPVSTMIGAGQQFQEMRSNMERITDVLEYDDDPFVNNEKSSQDNGTGKLSGNIEFRNVTFGYSRLAAPLIKNFNLTITPGQKIALVGSSGCGKSTISKLMSGLYRPWEGEILYDGIPMDEIDRNVFTSSIAVVDQDIILFEDTVAENIRMWDSSIEDFEIIMAARDADLHNDIMARKGGYECMLAEGGKNFSGGQRQRIEIARSLAQDPTIIIMDEATSALDAKTEYEVVKSISDRGITCVVVAHRLSTIRDCDMILVINDGEVVEKGTHDELISKGGYYKDLVTSE